MKGMEDIELVIKVPKAYYELVLKKCLDPVLLNAFKNGTPLPKGHGRIGDLDALRCENADFDTYRDYCTMFDEIDAAETIIEADKAEEDNKKIMPWYLEPFKQVIETLKQEPTTLTIPDNPTNGDVLKWFGQMYNDLSKEWVKTKFSDDWWNAPYKGESEETDI